MILDESSMGAWMVENTVSNRRIWKKIYYIMKISTLTTEDNVSDNTTKDKSTSDATDCIAALWNICQI